MRVALIIKVKAFLYLDYFNMNSRFIVSFLILLCLVTDINAQTLPIGKDTVLTQRQKDRLFLKQAGQERIAKFNKAFSNTWN